MTPVHRFSSLVVLLLTMPSAVQAHPGHVHGAGPVHGVSWMDLVLFLAVSLVLPAAGLLVACRRGRHRR